MTQMKNKMENPWHDTLADPPKEGGEYLCATWWSTHGLPSYRVLDYSMNLYQVDKYEFADRKGKAGWYYYDSEWGYRSRDDVTHWMPIHPLPDLKQEAADA